MIYIIILVAFVDMKSFNKILRMIISNSTCLIRRSNLIDLTWLFLNFHIGTNYSIFVLLIVVIICSRIKTKAPTFITVLLALFYCLGLIFNCFAHDGSFRKKKLDFLKISFIIDV